MNYPDGLVLRDLRKKYSLSVVSAAHANKISPLTLTSYEQGKVIPSFSLEEAEDRYIKHIEIYGVHGTDNLLFCKFPISAARLILGINIDEISAMFNTTRSVWTKYEANSRKLPESLCSKLEALVAKSLREVVF